MGGVTVPQVDHHKHLGIHFTYLPTVVAEERIPRYYT